MNYLSVFYVGCIIGSFLLVVAQRIPLGKSILVPRSHCVKCKTNLKWSDLIPIFSAIFLKNQCRYCHYSFSNLNLFCEIISGILVLSYYINYPNIAENTWILILLLVNFTLSLTDYQFGIVEPKIFYSGIFLVIFLYIYQRSFSLDIIYTPIIISIFFFLFHYFFPDKLGKGDSKLLIAWSIFLSYHDIAFIVLLASFIALIYYFLFPKRYPDNHFIPFVPFLSIGFYLFVIFLS